MKKILRNRKGAVLIIFAILLIVLIGFVALAVDVGRWYTVRAELSKAVDAGAFAGAKNISNRHLDEYYSAPNEGHLRFAEDIAHQNFFSGYLMTTDKPTFTATELSEHRIQVEGSVKSPPNLTSLFAVDLIPTASSGIAKKNKVEIMLVLDRSRSMAGSKITDLKTAAKSFVSYFEDTQDKDKMGLISFATSVTLDVALGNNYVTNMNNKINAMSATGATNAADALDRPLRTNGFTDQTGVPGDNRVQQFVIFFSDGMPTALRHNFRYRNTNYDAVACALTNCRSWETPTVYERLGLPTSETWLTLSGSYIDPLPTGDGSTTQRHVCGSSTNPICNDSRNPSKCCDMYTTRWYLFDTMPVPGYSAQYLNIPDRNVARHICNTARTMALTNAQTLKDKYIRIYVIGLGTSNEIDEDYLRCISSDNCRTGSNKFTYITPDSRELQAIFNTIAKEIKLRLVE